jgi:hypothetical protein
MENWVFQARPSVGIRPRAIAKTTVGLMVIIIVLVGAIGTLLFTSQSTTRSVASTTTTTVTIVNPTAQTNITTTSCTILAPTFGVVIRVLTNSTSPLVGARVSGQSVGYCNGLQDISPFQPTTTNSSGWASLLDGGFGIYYLDISRSYIDQGQNYTNHYSLSIPTQSLAVTYVIFYYPSGNVTTHFCYNLHC